MPMIEKELCNELVKIIELRPQGLCVSSMMSLGSSVPVDSIEFDIRYAESFQVCYAKSDQKYRAHI